MAKKKAGAVKAQAKAAKKAKAAAKVEKKEKKKSSKSKDLEDDDEDLEGILEKMRKEWEEAHKVTEELVEGPPSRRANASLTACPNGNHLWCIGGEFFSDDNKAYFYNDVFRYSPEKVQFSRQDEWRKFISKTCPGPRSAHAVVATPAGGGKLFLFGGEFSSLHQTTFHHYGDFWCFDITTHTWDRIETKIRPSPRSGHRMAFFKHFIVLFGGFYDPGITTRYHNDLWVFDTQEYVWRQIEFRENESRPSPRSGFSFLPCPDGILLHGGYCKEYAKGKRPVGVMLEDTWFLHLAIPDASTQPQTPTPASKSSKSKAPANPLTIKWERRKKPSYAPSTRSGCTMALWANKNQGILFGGVTDEDRHEETLESVFWNDLYGYQIPGRGRWVSMALKRPKKKGGEKKKQKAQAQQQRRGGVDESDDSDTEVEDEGSDEDPEDGGRKKKKKGKNKGKAKEGKVVSDPAPPATEEIDPDDPVLTTPIARYNTMLAVLRNTLYLYGGIFERGSKEYTLDDFYSLALDKLDKYVCLKASSIVITEGDDESSSEDDEEDDEYGSSDGDDSEDEEEDGGDKVTAGDASEGETVEGPSSPKASKSKRSKKARKEEAAKAEELAVSEVQEDEVEEEEEPQSELRTQATEFMGVSKDATRSPEDILSTPLPGETLAMFYSRSREYWAQKAFSVGEGADNKGKQLRQEGFALAQTRYMEYKPVLQEVEKILEEAGLDEAEMRRVATAGPAKPGVTQSRNRR